MSEIALTDRESRRLKSLEKSISDAGGTMYESLRAIHDERLYRDKFETWEAYCGKRWGMSKRHADRLLEHGRVMSLLSDDETDKTGPIGPIPEAATREVAGLSDETKVEVITAVASEAKPSTNGKPRVTAAAVKAKVVEIGQKLTGRTKPKTSVVSCAKMVDGLSGKHVGPLVRGIDEVAKVNGGKGDCHRAANESLNDLIGALKRMRGGER